jgi:ribosomal protein S18 acetylase RimI-like enzyme
LPFGPALYYPLPLAFSFPTRFQRSFVTYVKIRKATVDDVPFLIEAGRDSLSAHWSERQYWDLFEGVSGDDSRLVLVAEKNDEQNADEAAGLAPAENTQNALPQAASASRPGFAGFLVARHVAAEWELENIVVSPAARRNRLGMRLLGALLGIVRDANSDAVFLEVREGNTAARGLYEKLGFLAAGRRKSYYSNPLEDAILYRWRVR